MTLFSKFKWVASILLVFGIVLITNLIDKKNFDKLRNSVTTIYEDRLVAKNLLFEISMLIQKKEIALIASDSLFMENGNEKVDEEIGQYLEKFKQTKLTSKEEIILNNLKDDLSTLKKLENTYFNSESTDNTALLTSIKQINQKLYDLAQIQLEEGSRQVALSNQTMDKINFATQGEIIFLIIMAILVQLIILYNPKKR